MPLIILRYHYTGNKCQFGFPHIQDPRLSVLEAKVAFTQDLTISLITIYISIIQVRYMSDCI